MLAGQHLELRAPSALDALAARRTLPQVSEAFTPHFLVAHTLSFSALWVKTMQASRRLTSNAVFTQAVGESFTPPMQISFSRVQTQASHGCL